MKYPNIHQYPVLGIDSETTGLRWWADKLFGFSIASPDGKAWYFDIRKNPESLSWLRDELKDFKGNLVGHNQKFDCHFFREAGVQLPEDQIDCTNVRAALIDEHMLAYDLDSLCKAAGIPGKADIWGPLAEKFGGKPTRNAQIGNLSKAPHALAGKYAADDARAHLALWQWQEAELEKQELTVLHREVERPLIGALVEMERGGVRVDLQAVQEALPRVEQIIGKSQRDLDNLAGYKINTRSGPQMLRLVGARKEGDVWRAKDGTVLNKTAGGNASIGKEALLRMKLPEADLVLRLRKYLMVRDTFMQGHILGHHHNGVIHANFNQTRSENEMGTTTGRLSVDSPALQQIHKRDPEVASLVRAWFIPDRGTKWLCRDWEQMDFRVFAHYVNNPDINARYAADPHYDFHQMVADLMKEAGMPIPRKQTATSGNANAKQINLAMIFGMGPGRLAAEMGMPYTRFIKNGREFLVPGDAAKEVVAKYHEAVPGVAALRNDCQAIARKRGYVRAIDGRRIHFPHGLYAYKAAGLLFQAGCAAALKQKLVEIHRYIRTNPECGARLNLTVHDEFDFAIQDGTAQIHEDLRRIIETFDGEECRIKFRIPIRSGVGEGANWWQASK